MRTPEKQTKKGGDWLGKMASLLQELQKTRPFDKYQREKCAKLCERAHSRISSMLIQSLFYKKRSQGDGGKGFLPVFWNKGSVKARPPFSSSIVLRSSFHSYGFLYKKILAIFEEFFSHLASNKLSFWTFVSFSKHCEYSQTPLLFVKLH